MFNLPLCALNIFEVSVCSYYFDIRLLYRRRFLGKEALDATAASRFKFTLGLGDATGS